MVPTENAVSATPGDRGGDERHEERGGNGELPGGEHAYELLGVLLAQERVRSGGELLETLGRRLVRTAFGEPGTQEEGAGREPERQLPRRRTPCPTGNHAEPPSDDPTHPPCHRSEACQAGTGESPWSRRPTATRPEPPWPAALTPPVPANLVELPLRRACEPGAARAAVFAGGSKDLTREAATRQEEPEA
ncbi:hypothetical protein GCM10017778_56350 [Streptomyces vinaceus]|nr:hypothetical protein GCM10017778_56350 [Streptomyces vinaceus]